MPEIIRGKIIATDKGNQFLVNLSTLPPRTSVELKPLKIDYVTKELVVVIEQYNCLDCGFTCTSAKEMLDHQNR